MAHFVDIYHAQPLTTEQLKVNFRIRNHDVKLASNSFFFEEGQAEHFSQAKYGEFRVNERGELLLVSLLDEKLQRLWTLERWLVAIRNVLMRQGIVGAH